MEYGTGFGYRENFISTKNITMCNVTNKCSTQYKELNNYSSHRQTALLAS